MNEFIEVKKARTNNLKGVDLKIPLNQVTCISGPSGSGKSSLAFHTIFAESKRRFMNSLPNSFRFFSEKPAKADVDQIFPVLPAWVLPQNNPILSSRQNVSDLLDITRLSLKFFSLNGELLCPEHNSPLEKHDLDTKITSFIKNNKLEGAKSFHLFLKKTDYEAIFESSMIPSRSIKTKNSEILPFEEGHHYFELLRLRPKSSGETLKRIRDINPNILGKHLIVRFDNSDKFIELEPESKYSCSQCDFEAAQNKLSVDRINVFSPLGACPNCKGYGSTYIYDRKKLIKDPSLTINEGAVSIVESAHFDYYSPILKKELKKVGIDINKPFSKLPQKVWKLLYDGIGDYPGFNSFFDYLERKKYKKTVRIYTKRIQSEKACIRCHGSRILKDNHSLSVFQKKQVIGLQSYFTSKIEELLIDIKKLEKEIKSKDLKQIIEALSIACDLGVGYLPLHRKVKTLSASEYQRILLIKYFLFKGSGSLFVFDEPSLGLRYQEQKMILKYMNKLRDQNNTVLLVDHSEFFQSNCDQIVSVGPGAGPYGGKIEYVGPPKKSKKKRQAIKKEKFESKGKIKIEQVEFYESQLKKLEIEKEALTCVIGAPGVGKTKIFMEGLTSHLEETFEGTAGSEVVKMNRVSGMTDIEGFNSIDGYSLKANSRSSVGTYLEILPEFRKYYSELKTSRAMALEKGHFSPNSVKGKCVTCEGRGFLEADMKYFETVQYVCPDCQGLKLKPMYANISNGNFKYHEIISKPFCEVFEEIGQNSKVTRIKNVLDNFKLDYLSLDRSLTSLSGGERQRLKLAKYFLRERSHQILILENISFGLSYLELDHITSFLRQFCQKHNTVIIIDPNPIVAEYSDKILELKRKGSEVLVSYH